MEAWQQRVVDEAKELKEKLDKLLSYQDTEAFEKLPVQDKMLLLNQAHCMLSYQFYLNQRIQRFK